MRPRVDLSREGRGQMGPETVRSPRGRWRVLPRRYSLALAGPWPRPPLVNKKGALTKEARGSSTGSTDPAKAQEAAPGVPGVSSSPEHPRWQLPRPLASVSAKSSCDKLFPLLGLAWLGAAGA